MIDFTAMASRLTYVCSWKRRNENLIRTAALCAAICIAIAACSQPPTPDTAPAQLTRMPATPSPQPTIAPVPTDQPATPPLLHTPSLPDPPSVAIAPSIDQPTPAPTQTPPALFPPADVAFTQITAGKGHACGLRENGAIACWGTQNAARLGALNAPPETAFRQISAGQGYTCGLRQDAAIACWGLNPDGRASPPQGSFSEIAAGRVHACAIPLPQDSPPALLCWGAPFPNGAETLPLDAPISDIQSGGDFTCGLTPQANMACARMNQRLTEITPGPFGSLGVGLRHVCALREDGSAFCQDSGRQLRSIPPPTKFVQIAAGWHHSCGITRASRIECWGSGVPAAPGERMAAPNGEFIAISIGWRRSCALRPTGRAICWGTPDYATSSLIVQIPAAFNGAKFDAPVDIFPWPSGGLAIVDRSGVIAAYYDHPNAPPPQPILDLTAEVVCCPSESGMLSAALDPRFDEFPFLYVWYSAVADYAADEEMPATVGRLSRFRVNRNVALKNSELIILETHIPMQTHLGGAIRFGADGMLYLGIGDGWVQDNAQALNTLRGKIIRIDARGATEDRPYRIPPDNPFVDTPNARPEIWAYGLRNPWRMAFDPNVPNSLFVADVGRITHEEVSIATAGANLGWPLCEGDICQESLDAATAANLTPPAIAYGRDRGCAIIGGHFVPWLDNGFIFGDICSRRVWLLERNNPPNGAPAGPKAWRMREIADLSTLARNILAFGAGADGSVYVLTRAGPILRLQPDPAK